MEVKVAVGVRKHSVYAFPYSLTIEGGLLTESEDALPELDTSHCLLKTQTYPLEAEHDLTVFQSH